MSPPHRWNYSHTFMGVIESLNFKKPWNSNFSKVQITFWKTLLQRYGEYVYSPNTPKYDEIANIVILCEEALGFPRGDYKELVLLTLAYLNAAPEGFHLQRPGALHKACWMARLIYSIKIVLIQADKWTTSWYGCRQGTDAKIIGVYPICSLLLCSLVACLSSASFCSHEWHKTNKCLRQVQNTQCPNSHLSSESFRWP